MIAGEISVIRKSSILLKISLESTGFPFLPAGKTERYASPSSFSILKNPFSFSSRSFKRESVKFLRESLIRGFSLEVIVPFYNRNLSRKLECLERIFVNDGENVLRFERGIVQFYLSLCVPYVYDSFERKS